MQTQKQQILEISWLPLLSFWELKQCIAMATLVPFKVLAFLRMSPSFCGELFAICH